MQLDVGEGLVPLLERSVQECAWWDVSDATLLSCMERRQPLRQSGGTMPQQGVHTLLHATAGLLLTT